METNSGDSCAVGSADYGSVDRHESGDAKLASVQGDPALGPGIIIEPLREPPNVRSNDAVPHTCSESCLNEQRFFLSIQGVRVYDSWVAIENVSPYCVPLFFDWARRKSKSRVYYVAPCGKRFKNISLLYQFLLEVKSRLSVDQFTFEDDFSLYSPRESVKAYFKIDDLSGGREQVPVMCVNEIDSQAPEFNFQYITDYVPGKNVCLNFDKDFLISCECKDYCQRYKKCPCLGATREEAIMLAGQDSAQDGGYKYLNLKNHPVSLVFECNSKCKCDKRCSNRLVQHGLKHYLQVFKTSNRGWGVRTMHDIPRGSFICSYIGEVIDSAATNLLQRCGDYYAELDYIEDGRKSKRDFDYDSDHDSLLHFGTDSDISTPSESATDDEIVYNSDMEAEGNDISDNNVSGNEGPKEDCRDDMAIESQEIDSQLIDEVLNKAGTDFDQLESMNVDQLPQNSDDDDREQSTIMRHLDTEGTYVVDGNLIGNVGRFLNHSCEPNCRIRNIFIERQDYRFPTLAFFSTQNIKAFEELTWDYHYSADRTYPDSKQCLCGSRNCRKIIY